MKVHEILKAVKDEAILEYLISIFGYTKDELERVKIGLANLRNVTPVENDNKIKLYNDGISSRDQTMINGYALILEDWSKVLGCDIEGKVENKDYFMSILVQDMFFGTVDPNNVSRERENLNNDLKEAEKDIAEGRTYSAEEVFEHLRSKFSDIPETPVKGEVYKNVMGTRYEVITVGWSLDTYHCIVALKNLEDEKDDILMIDMEDMFKDVSDIKFSSGERKYRFEKDEST